MADVTDPAFRRIIAKYGKPDVLWTEFVAADGLCHPKGREKLLPLLQFSQTERPIVAQIFSAKPEKAREAAMIIRELGFDGVDINMGCPDRNVEKPGAGAALMKNSQLAREMIRAVKEGAGKMPVSVKTRLGYNQDELETWLPELLAEEPAAITIHFRTRKEMSKVAAHWPRAKRAVEIRDWFRVRSKNNFKTLLIGNGDVVDIDDARRKSEETGVDGVMFGRAIFGNPWLFATSGQKAVACSRSHREIRDQQLSGPSSDEKLRVLIEHTKLFEKLLGGVKSFAVMKKHFKAYVTGWEGAKELRIKLMETENAKEVEKIVKAYLYRG